jgi:hypothetical protein
MLNRLYFSGERRYYLDPVDRILLDSDASSLMKGATIVEACSKPGRRTRQNAPRI